MYTPQCNQIHVKILFNKVYSPNRQLIMLFYYYRFNVIIQTTDPLNGLLYFQIQRNTQNCKQNADPDQTASKNTLMRVYSVCLCIAI